MDAQKIEEKVEALLLAERVLSRAGLCWGDRYEELKAPIRKARSELSEVLQTLASKEAELVRLREAGKLAWRALCDAQGVLVTIDPEDASEGEKLEEITERVSACAGVLFCELSLPVAALTQPPKEPT